jgi:hypothetical protein
MPVKTKAATTNPYDDNEVIGKRVSVLFPGTKKDPAFYDGTVTKVMKELDESKEWSTQYHVEFDDGDKLDLDLPALEAEGEVKWLVSDEKEASKKSTKKAPAKKRKAIEKTNTEAKSTKKAKKQASETNKVSNSSIPRTLDDIIRLMDNMEPGRYYFDRQKDSRNGCSKTRKKLREYARKHEKDPAVKHWVETGKWEPPTEAALHALMDLIKTFVK